MKELEAKKVKVVVDKNPVATSFENVQPGHFSRTLAKGPKTTTWIGTHTLMLTILIAKLIH